MSYRIRELKPDQIQNIWDEWLGQYFRERLTGAPRIDDDEWSHMIEWCVPLSPVFSSVVELICLRPAALSEHTRIYKELERTEVAKKYPHPTSKLLSHLLKVKIPTYLVCNEVENIFRELMNTDVPLSELESILDLISLIGCKNALNLRNNLRSQASVENADIVI